MPFGLYIHVPFCRTKCPYCSFSSVPGTESLFDSYATAASLEIKRRMQGTFAVTPDTMYIGGGTPSLFTPDLIQRLVEHAIADFSGEFTIEANPDSVSESWLDGMLETGANRLSIGVQSLDDTILGNLGRIHTSAEAVRSVDLARVAGFSNISVDMMFGVPGQSLRVWRQAIEDVLILEPDHLSCYSLGIEEDTEYFRRFEDGDLDIPGAEETTDMYLLMIEFLENNGFVQYETSNFARRGHECQHNKLYWNFTPYLGIGSSAHSLDGEVRSWNVVSPGEYIERILRGAPAIEGRETIDAEKRLIETVMLSFRTRSGLALETLRNLSRGKKHSVATRIDALAVAGYLDTAENEVLKLTPRGLAIADEIIAELLADIL